MENVEAPNSSYEQVLGFGCETLYDYREFFAEIVVLKLPWHSEYQRINIDRLSRRVLLPRSIAGIRNSAPLTDTAGFYRRTLGTSRDLFSTFQILKLQHTPLLTTTSQV
jgi:hypothetical protein